MTKMMQGITMDLDSVENLTMNLTMDLDS